jgi:hypothetical protein
LLWLENWPKVRKPKAAGTPLIRSILSSAARAFVAIRRKRLLELMDDRSRQLIRRRESRRFIEPQAGIAKMFFTCVMIDLDPRYMPI